MRPRVLSTYRLPAPGLDKLEEALGERPSIPENAPRMGRAELLEKIDGADALLCSPHDRIDAELFGRARRLRVVSTYSVGFDHIDVAEATRRGIYVTHTPDVLSGAVADIAWGLLLAASRHIVIGDRYVREGMWKPDSDLSFMIGHDFHDKTLGIVGFGRIGAEIARRGKGFGMKILYFSRDRKPALEAELGAERADLHRLLSESDYVSVSLSLSDTTRGMIGERELSLMRRTAILVNTSRGAVIDESALAAALEEKRIAGAGLDVFEREPLPKDSPLLGLDSVVLLPHAASATVETRNRMAILAAQNIIDVLSGRLPRALLNGEVQAVRSLAAVRMI
ncbi:MAG: D-glycerate dehydrogenase [Conexivisphaerales archaeon]